MQWTYDRIAEWFEGYFEDVRRNQGDLETVPGLAKYFSPDMELTLYTVPSAPPAKRMNRDDLLISFVHPGLQEDILPQHYAIDERRMIVAVQFEIRFVDRPSDTRWPPIQASAHYHLIVDRENNLKIGKIFYWTESLPQDVFDFWARHREEAFRKHALGYINS